MGSTQRKIIKNLFKNLQKKYKSIPELLPHNREVLELYCFTMFLENTTLEEALKAFSTLERYFIDWNEVRVSTTNELAALFPQLNDLVKTGERLRRILQWIFEVRYKFDLEDLRSQNAETVLEFFKTIPYSTSFMNVCMIFLLFDKTPIPLDEGAKRVLRLLECMDINDQNKEDPQGLEAISLRTDKVLFFAMFHNLGALMMQEDKSEAIKFLKTIDSEADVRTWLPLVESDEIDDPAEIARQMMQKERHRVLPPIQLENDIDLLDDNYDTPSLASEADNFNPAEEEFSESPIAEETVFEHTEEISVSHGKKQDTVKIKKTSIEISVKQKKNTNHFDDPCSEETEPDNEPLKARFFSDSVKQNPDITPAKSSAQDVNAVFSPITGSDHSEPELIKTQAPKTQINTTESAIAKENVPFSEAKAEETASTEKKSSVKGTKTRKVASDKANSAKSEKAPAAKEGKRKKNIESAPLTDCQKNVHIPSDNIESVKTASESSAETITHQSADANASLFPSSSEMKTRKKGSSPLASDKAAPKKMAEDKTINNNSQDALPKIPEKKTAAPKKPAPNKKSEKNVKPVKAVPPPSKTVKEADVKKLQKKKPR